MRNHPPSLSSRSSGAGTTPFIPPGIGDNEMPQLPATTVVTPWLTFGAIPPADNINRSSCVCASMKPGAATFPDASTSTSALAPSRRPIFAMRSPRTPMSPSKRAAPLPSMMVALRISKSNCSLMVSFRKFQFEPRRTRRKTRDDKKHATVKSQLGAKVTTDISFFTFGYSSALSLSPCPPCPPWFTSECSVYLGAGAFDDFGPARPLAPGNGEKLFRRAAVDVGIEFGETLAHCRRMQGGDYLAIQLRDDLRGKLRRADDSSPRHRLVARHTRFGNGRQVRKQRGAMRAGHRQWPHPPGLRV